MGKRQFGTVRKLPSRRWQARYRGVGGQMVSAPRTFAAKTDAGLWLDNRRAEQVAGRSVDPSRARVRLKDYAVPWLGSHVGIAPRTREIYELQLRCHILPRIDPAVPAVGDVALGELTPELIRGWHTALARTKSASAAAKSLRPVARDPRAGRRRRADRPWPSW